MMEMQVMALATADAGTAVAPAVSEVDRDVADPDAADPDVVALVAGRQDAVVRRLKLTDGETVFKFNLANYYYYAHTYIFS